LRIVGYALLWALALWLANYVWWPLAFGGLVPFARLAAGEDRYGVRLAAIYISGAIYFAAGEYWFALYSPGAWAILAALQALSLLPVALALRESRRRNIPMAAALPLFWVAGEYLRALGPFGFPIGSLAPVLHRQLWAIQIADLGGMFAVSFALAMANGALIDMWNARQSGERLAKRTAVPFGAAACVWIAVAIYGRYRLAESGKTHLPGPVVAVIQPDVPYAADVGEGYDPPRFFDRLVELSREAARQRPAPALIVWPESGLLPPLNSEFWQADATQIDRIVAFARRSHPSIDADQLRSWLKDKMRLGAELRTRAQTLAEELNASLVIGAPMRIPRSDLPSDPWRNYNAAFFFRPHLAPVVQAKVHPFPMSERIPFVGTWAEAPFRWLAEITGAYPEFELDPGEKLVPLELGDGAGAPRFIVPICGEIDLASTAGIFLPQDPPRFIVNISDDGSFQRSAMLLVRQSMLAYRAVEARAGVARSANTGVSCFVRPTGEIYGAVQNGLGESWTGRGFPERAVIAEVLRRKTSPGGATAAEMAPLVAEIRRLRAEAGVEGYSVQRIDLDSRRTVYSRVGDLFAQLCTGALLLALFATAFRRRISA
jgi:apolipoprotein N-acyltransferase